MKNVTDELWVAIRPAIFETDGNDVMSTMIVWPNRRINLAISAVLQVGTAALPHHQAGRENQRARRQG